MVYMRITKCDLCKKKINGEPITVGIGFFPRFELCEKCGDFIVKLRSDFTPPLCGGVITTPLNMV